MTTRGLPWCPVVGLLVAVGLLARAVDPPPAGLGGGKPAAKTDAPSDPLPEGAKARLGTGRYRIGPQYGGVSVSPDGKTIAFQAADRQIMFMDAATGLAGRRLQGTEPFGFGGALVFAADGKRGAVPTTNGVVVVGIGSGRHLARVGTGPFAGRVSGVVALSADGNRLAVGAAGPGGRDQKTAAVWDVTADKAVATVRPLQNQSVSVALSADGKTLATWGQHFDRAALRGKPGAGVLPVRVVQVWDVEKQAERGRVAAAGSSVATAALSPDGAVVAVAGRLGPVELFETAAGKSVNQFAPAGRCKRWSSPRAGSGSSPSGPTGWPWSGTSRVGRGSGSWNARPARPAGWCSPRPSGPSRGGHRAALRPCGKCPPGTD